MANYRKWIKDIDELQSTRVVFPMLSDPDCKVLREVGFDVLYLFLIVSCDLLNREIFLISGAVQGQHLMVV